MLVTEGVGKTTRIKVVNYHHYDPKKRANNGEITSRERADNEQGTTDKNEKKVNNEKNKEKHVCGAENLVEVWNIQAAVLQLPTVRVVTAKRKAVIAQRLREDFFAENWEEALRKIGSIPWMLGQGEKGWKANLEFFLRPDTVVKIMEGQYDGRAKGGGKDIGRGYELAKEQPDKFGGR